MLLYMCPHTTIEVSAYYYMCPHTTICVSSYYYRGLILLWMCPHTTKYVSSYHYICVLILLYFCPATFFFQLKKWIAAILPPAYEGDGPSTLNIILFFSLFFCPGFELQQFRGRSKGVVARSALEKNLNIFFLFSLLFFPLVLRSSLAAATRAE